MDLPARTFDTAELKVLIGDIEDMILVFDLVIFPKLDDVLWRLDRLTGE